MLAESVHIETIFGLEPATFVLYAVVVMVVMIVPALVPALWVRKKGYEGGTQAGVFIVSYLTSTLVGLVIAALLPPYEPKLVVSDNPEFRGLRPLPNPNQIPKPKRAKSIHREPMFKVACAACGKRWTGTRSQFDAMEKCKRCDSEPFEYYILEALGTPKTPVENDIVIEDADPTSADDAEEREMGLENLGERKASA